MQVTDTAYQDYLEEVQKHVDLSDNRRRALEALREAPESIRWLGQHVNPSDMTHKCACAVMADAIGFEYSKWSFDYDGLAAQLGLKDVTMAHMLNDASGENGVDPRWKFEEMAPILEVAWRHPSLLLPAPEFPPPGDL